MSTGQTGLPSPAAARSSAGRLHELDSVRGLAALSVVCWHMLAIFPLIYSNTDGRSGHAVLNAFKYTPLHVFFAGSEAVITFFVLSGFVLSLPFYGPRPPRYRDFIVKRVCRIWIPYIAAVSLGAVLDLALYRGRIKGVSAWVANAWTGHLSLKDVVGHLTLIGSFNNNAIDPVIWSLVHEMRISLIFPLIVWLVIRTHWRTSLGVGIALAFLSAGLAYIATHKLHYQSDYPDTLQYIVMFISGALLARHRETVVAWFRALPVWIRLAWLPVGVLFYTYPYWLHRFHVLHLNPEDALMTGVGATMFIAGALSSRGALRVLRSRPLVFLGQISYSLYLLHAIIILSLVHLAYGVLPTGVILAFALSLALAAAALSYYSVELPGIALGRRLTTARPGQPAGVEIVRPPVDPIDARFSGVAGE